MVGPSSRLQQDKPWRRFPDGWCVTDGVIYSLEAPVQIGDNPCSPCVEQPRHAQSPGWRWTREWSPSPSAAITHRTEAIP